MADNDSDCGSLSDEVVHPDGLDAAEFEQQEDEAAKRSGLNRVPVVLPPRITRLADVEVPEVDFDSQTDLWRVEIGQPLPFRTLCRQSEEIDYTDPYWIHRVGMWVLEKVNDYINNQDIAARVRNIDRSEPGNQFSYLLGVLQEDVPVSETQPDQEITPKVMEQPGQSEDQMEVNMARIAWIQEGDSVNDPDAQKSLKSRSKKEKHRPTKLIKPTTDLIERVEHLDQLMDPIHMQDDDVPGAKKRLSIHEEQLLPSVPGMRLGKRLYDHQIIGVDRLRTAFLDSRFIGHCLSDDVGLGKTVTAIAFLLSVSTPWTSHLLHD